MQLEELEVVFKANYGDLVSKTQQIYQLIESKTNALANNIQNDLNRANQATQSGVQSANQAAEATVQSEQRKQQAYKQTADAQRQSGVEIQTWSDNHRKALEQATQAAKAYQDTAKEASGAATQGFQNPEAVLQAVKEYQEHHGGHGGKCRLKRSPSRPTPKLIRPSDSRARLQSRTFKNSMTPSTNEWHKPSKSRPSWFSL